jgi:hypothetical protein
MTVESQLRDHAARIEVVPISIDEMTGRGHVAPPTRWQRPALAAAAVVLMMGGVAVFARSSGRSLSTTPSATTGAPALTATTTATTVVADSGVPGTEIAKRWMPSYLPAGWKVAEETVSTEVMPFVLSIQRDDAAMFAIADEPDQPAVEPSEPQYMFADRIEVAGRPAVLVNSESRLYLHVPGDRGFGLVSLGFSEQEVREAAAAITIDRTSGSISAPPAGATAGLHLARSSSSVRLRLVDETGVFGGTIFIGRSEEVADYAAFSRVAGATGSTQDVPGGFMANARLVGIDDAESARVLSSLAEVDPSTVPTVALPEPAIVQPQLAHLTVDGVEVEVVGPRRQVCIRVVGDKRDLCPADIAMNNIVRSVPDGGGWITAGVVVSPAGRVVVEFSDGSTVEAVTAPLSPGSVSSGSLPPGDSVLYGARVPDKLIVRSVIVYDATGTQVQRLGRPPRPAAA